MENKLFLELEFATGVGISLVGASTWQSRVVMAGRGMSACQESESKDSYQNSTLVSPPEKYESSYFYSFSVLFLDWLLKKRGLGDCTPCAQLRVAVKPSLFPAQLRALLHWDVVERVRSQ